MKNLFLSAVIVLFASNVQAQNTNRKVETTTTTVTKKDNEGEKVTTKSETSKEVQKVELGAPTPGTINVPTVDSPTQVLTTTIITNPDGSTRTVDVDRSAFYESKGNKYKLDLDASGYVLTLGNAKPALLRKTSINSYIYNTKNRNAIAYFDINGNLIVESYDPKTDRILTEKFMLASTTQVQK